MKAIKHFILVLFLGCMVYFAYYQNNIGLQNIGLTILWFFTVILFIASWSKEKRKKINLHWFEKLIGRILWIGVILALLYGGAVVMGSIWILSIIIIKSIYLMNEKKEKENDGKEQITT